MHCPSCGHEPPAGSPFCNGCGAKLVIVCASCGATPPPGSRFCNGCGATLGAAPASAAPARAPRDYTPKHLADKILQSKSALEGERKQVTVLFADVKGSMDLAAQLDPEEWHRILERFFEILTEGVHRFEGTVNQYTGDGIMALFGAPIAHEDHAQRACYAALHLQEALRGYANELRLRRGLNFSARLGLNSGAVIVAAIGDDLRMDYTAQGQTVGLAARMEQIAEPGKIYLTANTAALVDGYFALSDLGAMEIKGVQGALHVHELQGVGQLRTRLDVSRSRGFSRFVGRGDEMQLLEAALARARDGNAQIVGIVGEAGLGKSRLCFEFLERCRARGLMAYETTGVSHGKTIPFLPMLRLFRAFFGINEQDSDATARERIAGRLLLLDERLRESLPLLFDFMGVADPEHPAPSIAPEARQRQMFDIVRRVVQARGQKETTVTLLEDLHWFDGGSAAFLEPLIEASVGTRALVLLNFRPEYQAPWMGKSYYQQLPLAPLGPEAIRELLSALLGSDPSTTGLADVIHARTAGNPFFTEEVVQNLIETRKLQGAKGAYKLVTPIDKLEVPSTVQALLAARIDRLAEREKDVLQTAAVIGREFDEPTLTAVVGIEASLLREALQKLKDTEFIREQSLYPVAEYLFKHPLTQEVALTSQLQERRRKLHAAVARVIEAAHAADLDQQAALLAHHWEQAADSEQAVRWHERAAEWAGTRDPVAGLRHWHKVRELSRSLGDAVTSESHFRACKMILAGGTWRLGMSEEDVQECLDEARELARVLGRPADMAVPLAGFAMSRGFRGRADTILALTREARAMLHDRMGPGEDFCVLVAHAWSAYQAGHVQHAIEASSHIIERSGGDPHVGREFIGVSPSIWADYWAFLMLASAGQFDACWVRAERAVRTAREHDAQENIVYAIWGLGISAYLAGGTSGVPVPDLRRTCVEGVEIAEALGSPNPQVAATCALAIAHFLNGDCDIAEARLREALAEAHLAGTGLDGQGYMLAVFADSCRARGDAEAAIARAREAVELTDAGGFRFQAAVGRAALADALVHTGAPAHEIVEVIAAARAIVEETGGNSLLPRLREAEVRLAARGDATLLAAGLREAEAMYRAMGAPDPADRLARELAA
jgi:class 3 adenylate cyclase